MAAKEIGCVLLFCKVQAKALGTRSENWFWLLGGTGTDGKGLESGNDFAAQQLILPPQWQLAWFCLAQGGAACAKRNGAPASRNCKRWPTPFSYDNCGTMERFPPQNL